MGLSFRKASYEPGVVEFGTGSFAYLQPDGGWGFSNAGLVTDGGEALLVDTMFDTAHTRAMLDGFKKVSSAKIAATETDAWTARSSPRSARRRR